ncbi:hypothetical protein AM493_14540 [Flavobacterium akiainvivens]|uniref:Uncharacterized protein n=1 Tax=Flavobacterium akiainvivens TaxID=1202724 RepID=A0A0M9VIX2_9FLAO|nr:hypothetical protein [Flavobacterium akiainvivens]KOS07120.1 hypothetical protein AM493_14540 [Flavobacterium akiainvivens]SFQ75827.1 hypothetical protein SAMN05444144_12238 [Flavobacterium akiainvivens]
MTSEINSRNFFSVWKKIVGSRKDMLSNDWRKHAVFTSHVKGNDDSIIKEIAGSFGLLYYNEYYSLDVVLYKEEDLVPDITEGWCWLRNIRIAFEHENNFNRALYQEVSHLLITNCELRVLVTYPNGGIDEMLKYLREIIKGSRQSHDISKSENFLLIFGYEEGFAWEGYIYNTENWIKIDESKI